LRNLVDGLARDPSVFKPVPTTPQFSKQIDAAGYKLRNSLSFACLIYPTIRWFCEHCCRVLKSPSTMMKQETRPRNPRANYWSGDWAYIDGDGYPG